MLQQLHYQIETRPDAAVMYLAGVLRLSDVPHLDAVCAALPTSITALRVDLHALVAPEAGAVSAVREVLHTWRDARGGAFRFAVCTSHLVASYGGALRDERPASFAPHDASAAAALLAG